MTTSHQCIMVSHQAADKMGNLTAATATSHRDLVAKVQQYAKADYLILNGPPRITELTRAILVLADLCLIPVGSSAAEIWATGDILALIEEAKKVRQVTARMVWTRYRPHTLLAQGLTTLATKELGLAALGTSLGMRVAYMQALGEGLTVAELADPHAKIEIKFLVEEAKKLLKVKT
jgi:chromosome partitioning protein